MVMLDSSQRWTEEQLKLAFYLYCQLPFGKMHSKNPVIIKTAELIGRSSNALAMKLVNFASLDPTITSSGRKGLGNASELDKKTWDMFHDDWDRLAEECALLLQGNKLFNLKDDDSENNDYIGETRESVTKVRIGQSFFRKSVLASYESVCCMSGVSIPELLIASHIIPWSKAEENRLNPRNGLCLSSIHDRAFDKGFLTVDTNYKIIVSKELKVFNKIPQIDILNQLDGKEINLPKKFYPEKDFLEWHNTNVFRG